MGFLYIISFLNRPERDPSLVHDAWSGVWMVWKGVLYPDGYVKQVADRVCRTFSCLFVCGLFYGEAQFLFGRKAESFTQPELPSLNFTELTCDVE